MGEAASTATWAPERWDLSTLLEDGECRGLEPLLERLEGRVRRFEAYREQLVPDLAPETFQEILRLSEAISADRNRVGYYAHLQVSADLRDDQARALAAWWDRISAEIENRIRFFELWWQDLDTANADRLLAYSGDLHYNLVRIRELKEQTLSDSEERILTLLGPTGASAQARLRDQIAARYKFSLSVGGRRRVAEPEARTLIRSADPAIRRDAYRALHRRYAADGDLLGEIYQTIVREWQATQVTLRGYERPISARNARNDLPDSAVATLLAVCRQNATVFQDYFVLKAKLLGLGRLRRYDLYAPLGKNEASFSYGEAVQMVLDSFERFSPVVATAARRVFQDHHVDAEVRDGKRGGAFCASPGSRISPYVFLSYAGASRDVSTLAHELGHAIHGILAEDHSVSTFHSPLPLAETASIFAETILIDRLATEAASPADRIQPLARQLDEAYGSVGRQAFFVLFEEAAHDATRDGATVSDLCRIYYDNLKSQFGRSISLSSDFAWEWVEVPHFFRSPFYCYAYSFGTLLALALYSRYLEEGPSFAPRYLELLAAGGSVRPADLLKRYGYDLSDPAFWQSGYDYLAGKVAEVRYLTDNTPA